MEYKFESCLMKRKSEAQDKLDKLKIEFLKQLDFLESMDNTNSDIICTKLNIKISNKLLFTNFDVLTKDELSKFGVIKTLNNRESFFELLEYLEVVKIIKEEEEKKEKIVKNVKRKNKKPIFTIDFSQGKIQILDKSKNEIELNFGDKDKSEICYKEMIGKKSTNFYKYFGMEEKIIIKNIRKKIDNYLNELIFEEEYKNNILDSESELFFFNHIQNLIYSFKELNDEKFLKKLIMIKNLSGFIDKVKENKITDELILNYFYLVIGLEYELSTIAKNLLYNYEEKATNFKDVTLDLKEKTLKIHFSKIIIKNFDYYNLNDSIIKKIKYGKISLPLDEIYYSLRGYLCLREFTKKDGNLIYEKFLTSKLLEDIILILYEKENIFSSTDVIKLFQENTFYFPIENSRCAAYSDKKNFKIYIDYKVGEDKIIKSLELNQKIKHFIKKSFLILNIVHEFGHSHHAFLYYYDPKNNYFDSPLIKIKLDTNHEYYVREGGNLFEYMLFGRIINEMNIKEIIYICNLNNFSKSVEEYRRDFLNLKNKSVNQVFKTESENNFEIQEIFNLYKKLSFEEKTKLEKIIINQGKKIIINDSSFNIEDYSFSSGILNKSHYDSRRGD